MKLFPSDADDDVHDDVDHDDDHDHDNYAKPEFHA